MTFFLLASAAIHGVYQVYGDAGTTNWDIVYNANTYMLYAAVAYGQADEYKEVKYARLVMRGICLFFTYFMMAEFSFWNETYEAYLQGMKAKAFYNQTLVLIGAVVLVGAIDILKRIINKDAT